MLSSNSSESQTRSQHKSITHSMQLNELVCNAAEYERRRTNAEQRWTIQATKFFNINKKKTNFVYEGIWMRNAKAFVNCNQMKNVANFIESLVCACRLMKIIIVKSTNIRQFIIVFHSFVGTGKNVHIQNERTLPSKPKINSWFICSLDNVTRPKLYGLEMKIISYFSLEIFDMC